MSVVSTLYNQWWQAGEPSGHNLEAGLMTDTTQFDEPRLPVHRISGRSKGVSFVIG